MSAITALHHWSVRNEENSAVTNFWIGPIFGVSKPLMIAMIHLVSLLVFVFEFRTWLPVFLEQILIPSKTGDPRWAALVRCYLTDVVVCQWLPAAFIYNLPQLVCMPKLFCHHRKISYLLFTVSIKRETAGNLPFLPSNRNLIDTRTIQPYVT